MLKYRLISGPILIVAFLALAWFDNWLERRTGVPAIAFLALLLVTLPLMARELSVVFRMKEVRGSTILTMASSLLGLISMALLAESGREGSLLAPAHAMMPTTVALAAFVTYVMGLVALTRGQQTQGVIVGTSCMLFAMLYLGVLPGFYFLLREAHSAWWIVGIVMTVKMTDTGAYTFGHVFGRRKLIPWLSPGKTREGFVGGIVTAMVVGMCLGALSVLLPDADDHVHWWVGGVWGIVLGVAGQVGDLAMSLAKRDAGMKDSSNVIPGMGGLLDVVDSAFFVAPVAYVLSLCTFGAPS